MPLMAVFDCEDNSTWRQNGSSGRQEVLQHAAPSSMPSTHYSSSLLSTYGARKKQVTPRNQPCPLEHRLFKRDLFMRAGRAHTSGARGTPGSGAHCSPGAGHGCFLEPLSLVMDTLYGNIGISNHNPSLSCFHGHPV